MSSQVHAEGNSLAVVCGEVLNASVANEFRNSAAEVLSRKEREVTLKLHNVSEVDSSGIGAIVFLHRRLVLQGRRLQISGLSGQPLELARLVRLDSAIPCDLPAAPVPAPKESVFAKLVAFLRPADAASVQA